MSVHVLNVYRFIFLVVIPKPYIIITIDAALMPH